MILSHVCSVTFLRIVHKIVHLRQLFPNKIIWIRKEDVKSAYRRIHMQASTALHSGVQFDIDGIEYFLISLRLPFGGSPCPSEFCLLSDILTDTLNDLMHCKEWNAKTMHSNYVSKNAKCQKLASSIPFAEGKEMGITLVETEAYKEDVLSMISSQLRWTLTIIWIG